MLPPRMELQGGAGGTAGRLLGSAFSPPQPRVTLDALDALLPGAQRQMQSPDREAPVPWLGLRSGFLTGRPAADQLKIFDLTARMAHALHRWAARYALIRRVRVWPLCLSVAAAAPFASVEALISTSRLSLWVFTLDDLFDEEHVPDQHLDRRATLYRAIARGECPPPPRDSLAVALGDVRDDLAGYPLFAGIGDRWIDALCGTIDAMRTEHRWRQEFRRLGPAALPTYEEYLAVGQYSIGAPPHVWASLITTGDPSTPLHLDHLSRMECAASTCIRLANDLQSWGKEVAEENVNALMLLGHTLMTNGLARPEALRSAAELARTAMAQSLASLAEMQSRRQTISGQPEAAIADIARFVSDFYVHHDYHTFTL